MKTPIQEGILIEFVFGNAPFRDGYTQIGSFKTDAPNWPHIYITAPADWVNTKYLNPSLVKDFLQEMITGFIKYFDEGKVDTSKDRFRYYLLNEKEDTAITLGYFCEGEEGIKFCGYDPLTAEEFLEFQDAQSRIAEFYRDTLWFTPITENYNLFCEVIQSIQEKFLKSGQPDYTGMDTVNINSDFNNYTASITSYLNYMEKRLKNKSEAMYWERFKTQTSGQYDQNISYRFIEALRNYIQHQAPPIHIRYKSELVGEKPIYQVDIFCLKEELLKDNSWKKMIKNDILGMDDMIDVSLHADSMMESLNQILINHLQYEFSYLRKSSEFIHNLIQRIPSGKDRGVYAMHFVDKKIVGITPYLMYTSIVEAIIENDINKILQIN